MRQASSSLVTRLRAASRDLVRELGFMSRTLAGTDLSPSAVHAVIEIGGGCSAKDLSQRLLLEKSTVSRLVKSLMVKGIVRMDQSQNDRRRKNLSLTAQGEKTAAAIATFAQTQVAAAIESLSESTRREILAGIETYAGALKAGRLSGGQTPSGIRVTVEQGYRPGLIGGVVELHASYYSRLAGFGAAFESQVASGLADFVARLESPANAIWRAERDGGIVGSIAIDGEDLAAGVAHLRWFIVGDGMRGAGVGKSLLRKALTFCDEREFHETHLWTFKGLDAARSLYENHGFSLAEEYHGDQWGSGVLEQKFVRPRP